MSSLLDDHDPDDLVHDAAETVDLGGDGRRSGERHQHIVAFGLELDVVGVLARTPFVQRDDFAAGSGDDGAEPVDDRLLFIFGQIVVDDVQKLVLVHINLLLV